MDGDFDQARQVYRRLIEFIDQKQNTELRRKGYADLNALTALASEVVEQIKRAPD